MSLHLTLYNRFEEGFHQFDASRLVHLRTHIFSIGFSNKMREMI